MNPPAQPKPVWVKQALGVVGLLIIVAAAGALVYAGWHGWTTWRHLQAAAKHDEMWKNSVARLAVLTTFLAVVGLIGIYGGVKLLQYLAGTESAISGASRPQPAVVGAIPRRKRSYKRWQSCNVLDVQGGIRQLWGFSAGRNGFALDDEATLPSDGPLPARATTRDWRVLLQPKLNVALLPVDKVFLRVIHLPVSDFEETLSMIELQLEKISPLPVTQVVWSIQVLPHTVDNLQTIVVTIAARDMVEQLLGRLEGQNYIADRLELPILDQLLATPITGDGAWIYPAAGGADTYSAVVAWWYGGMLRNLGLLHLAAGEQSAALLGEQLTHMAWSGELEGWLAAAPHWHLVADDNTAANWQALFRAWSGQPAEVIAPVSPPELAALTANRAARAEPRANLLPAEYLARYRRQFIDRLWMRGLGAVIGIYILCICVYNIALAMQDNKAADIEQRAGGLSHTYTNALQLKSQLQVLQSRQALKYASLECWNTTANELPPGFTVTSMDFRNGREFALHGTAPLEAGQEVNDFGEKMRKFRNTNDEPVFSNWVSSGIYIRGNYLDWGFHGELVHGEDMIK